MDQLAQQEYQEKLQILKSSFQIRNFCQVRRLVPLFMERQIFNRLALQDPQIFLSLTNLQEADEIFQKLMKNTILSISTSDRQLLEIVRVRHKRLVRITEQIKDLAKQIESMKEVLIKQIDSLKLEHQNQIQQLQNQITSLQENLNNIAQFDELEMIKKWISDKQINLKLIYRATANGFQFEKIYEKCQDKCKVILLVKTKEGEGRDIQLSTNSNIHNSSYVSQKSYGQKEGLTGHALNRGTRNFTTSEVEIFEVI
ncbi:hypothetical protein ABPG72_009279 [Tetrahymena utriculariae]